MKRREFIGVGVTSALLAPVRAFATVWNKAASDRSEASAADEIPSQDIDIMVASQVRDGASVEVAVISRIPNSEAIAIFVDKNPAPLVGNYIFSKQVQANIVTHIRLEETSDIKVIVKVGNRYYTTSKKVIVLDANVGDTTSSSFEPSIKVKAKQLKNSHVTQVSATIAHPMQAGESKSATDQLTSAHFIQLVTIKHNSQPAAEMQLSTGIAKNPHLNFNLMNAKVGDAIEVAWHDNLGQSGKADVSVIT